MSSVSLKIDGKDASLTTKKPLLLAVKEEGYNPPYLCCHEDVEKDSCCGVCLLEIDGEVVSACKMTAEENMEILTDSPRVREEVKKNLQEAFKKHKLKCKDCFFFQKCKLLELGREFGVSPAIEKEEGSSFQVGSILFDQEKCIGCNNCVSVCPVGFLETKEEVVEPSRDKEVDCTSCGQCALHCPVGAIKGEGEFEELEELEEAFKKKTVVVQFAPSIRTSIGEEFGMDAGTVSTGQLVSALRRSGFHYVFDTATGADFTTIEEAEELLERLSEKKNLPAMSSCCPAWVSFLEFNYPHLISNLCTSRSPQIILGTIIKEYWGKARDDIFVVSVMPCTAKKEEIKRKELEVRGKKAVDMVITTREAARLFKNKKVSFDKEEVADDPLGSPSGAGVIYGSSGGVFESALRTAFFRATGENITEITEIRGTESIKEKKIDIKGETLNVCVVSGLCNIKKVLSDVEKGESPFHAIEVMACPGGCVGGGGQPVPSSKKTTSQRGRSLYTIDAQKSVRRAHENKQVMEVYKEFLSNEEKRKEMLHTSYNPKKKKLIEKKDKK